jgi:hypothetical protein
MDAKKLFEKEIEDLVAESGLGSAIYWHTAFVKTIRELDGKLDSLRVSMESTAKSNEGLSKRILWLNIVLTLATFLGVFATIAGVVIMTIQLLK